MIALFRNKFLCKFKLLQQLFLTAHKINVCTLDTHFCKFYVNNFKKYIFFYITSLELLKEKTLHPIFLLGLKSFDIPIKFNLQHVLYFRPTAAASATTFHFLGSGYASIPKIPNYNSREFQISFHFKTFWANSTLLFAGNEQLVSVL